ncbi:MAG: peptidylprolyl isomerase [Myxococcales bacterium]|nr:peptidylprolyl isomerase [Myxococcales bacterium]
MRKLAFIAVLVGLASIGAAPGQDAPTLPEDNQVAQSVPPVGGETPEEILATVPGEGRIYATFTTSMGTIECELFDDLVPNTVANFVGLATGQKTYIDSESGEQARSNYYDGLIFHRVIPEFMIQGGDPTGTGRGGPGYSFNDEFHSDLRHDRPGVLSMANAGPNTNGSQFFITEVPTPHLNDRHSVFGYCDNVDVVRRIARVPTAAGNRPIDPVTIETITFDRRPAE